MLLLLLGVGLRAYDLTGQSFSFDETMDMGLARTTDWWAVSTFGVPWHIHPPFHLIAYKAWGSLAGWSELSLRLFSVALSGLAGYLTWRLGRELCNSHVAKVSLALWCLSPLSYFWARNVRSHALFEVLVLLSMLGAWRLAVRPTRRTALEYTLTTFLMMYTLHLGLVLALLQAVWFATRRSRVGMLAWLGAAFFYLPYAPQLLQHVREGISVYYQAVSHRDIWEAFETLCCYTFDHLGQPWVTLFFVPPLLLGLRRQPRAQARFLLLWLALPALVWILSQARPAFRFWYFDACLPPVFVLVACGLGALPRRAAALTLAALLAFSLAVVVDQQQNFRSQNFRLAVSLINEHGRERDVVLLANTYGYLHWAYRYYEGRLPWFELRASPEPKVVQSFFQAHPRVWVLANRDGVGYLEKLIEPHIPGAYVQTWREDFQSSNQGAFQFRLYERKSAAYFKDGATMRPPKPL